MLTVTSGRFELRAKGRILQFDGHTRVLPPAGKQDNHRTAGFEGRPSFIASETGFLSEFHQATGKIH